MASSQKLAKDEVTFGDPGVLTTWIDSAGALLFGKFRGKKLRDVSHHYLEWCAKNLIEDHWAPTRELIVCELARREFESDGIEVDHESLEEIINQEDDYSWLIR